MTCKRVAVVMPCYNAGKYIARTIESVLEQSYKNFHFIAGNDGSTDNTAEILNSYGDKITVVCHADRCNHGQAATYNLCLKYTNSEYIAFIDNDDLWHPDKLKKQVEILDSRSDIGLVYTNGDVIDESDNILYPLLESGHRETNEIGSILLNCYIRTPSTVMVRSSILRSVGKFKEGIIPDQDMWIRIKELTDFCFINEKLIYYRSHSEQLSNLSNKKMWKDALKTLNDAIIRYPYPRLIYRRRRAVIHYRLGNHAKHEHKYIAMFYHYIRVFFYDPRGVLTNIKWVLS